MILDRVGGLVSAKIAMSGTPASSVAEGDRRRLRGKFGKMVSLVLDCHVYGLLAVQPEPGVGAALSHYKLPGWFSRLTRLRLAVGSGIHPVGEPSLPSGPFCLPKFPSVEFH